MPPDDRAELIGRRDRFEELFRDLVGDLPLSPEIDRSIYRNLLLSKPIRRQTGADLGD
jgi:TetR/AcrR family transcriptional regulator, cholesterol catabolism regulator